MPRLHNACVVHSSYSLCISCQIYGENSLASPIPTVWVLEMLATTTARKKQLIGICSKQPLHEMEILVKDCAPSLPPEHSPSLPWDQTWAAGAKPGQGQRGKAAWGVSQAGSRRKVRQRQMQTRRHEGSRDRREGSAKEGDFEFCTSKTSVALESSVFLTL